MAVEPLVWEWDVGERFAVLTSIRNVKDAWQIAKGIPRAKGFPKDALFEMDPKFKKYVALSDNMANEERMLVVSKKLKDLVEARGPRRVEYLRVGVLNHKKKPVDDEYWIIHPVEVVDCIDTKRSDIDWNAIDKEKIASCEKLVLKANAIDGKHLLFRPKHLEYYVMILPELANAIREGGFTGLRLTPASSFTT
jgi:uncharacterized protein DUF1629